MLYNILFSKETIGVFKVLETIKKTDNDEIELRIRNVDVNMYNNVLKRLFSISDFKVDTINDVSYVYSLDAITSKRNIKNYNSNIYIKKTSINFLDVAYPEKYTIFKLISSLNNEIQCKISYSKEHDITKQEYEYDIKDKKILIRKRERTSFIKEGKYRIDLTKINEYKYEIEIEIFNYKEIIQIIKEALGYIFSYNSLISDVHLDRFKKVYDFLKVYREIKPININDKHLEILEKNYVSQYSVTNKLDGTKYYLCYIMQKNNTLLFLINSNNIILLSYNPSYDTELNEIIIFEVEILENFNGITNIIDIYTFDTIYAFDKTHNFNIKDNKNGHNYRIKISHEKEVYINNLPKINKQLQFTFKTKTFINDIRFMNSVKKTLKLLEDEFKTIENIEHMNDGLIFQPINENINPLKWKFVNKVSIDFLYENGKLYSYNKNTRRNEEFSDSKGNRYKLKETDFIIPNNSIIEVIFEYGKFIFHRFRTDKIFPNELTITARDTFKDMIEPFHLSKIYDFFKNKTMSTNNYFFENYVKNKELVKNKDNDKILECASNIRIFVSKNITRYIFENMDFSKILILNEFLELAKIKLNLSLSENIFQNMSFDEGIIYIINKNKTYYSGTSKEIFQKNIFEISELSINLAYNKYIESFTNKIEPYYYKRDINDNDIKIIKLLLTL